MNISRADEGQVSESRECDPGPAVQDVSGSGDLLTNVNAYDGAILQFEGKLRHDWLPLGTQQWSQIELFTYPTGLTVTNDSDRELHTKAEEDGKATIRDHAGNEREIGVKANEPVLHAPGETYVGTATSQFGYHGMHMRKYEYRRYEAGVTPNIPTPA